MTTEKKIEQFAESVRVAEVRRQRIMALLDDGMTRKEIAALEGMSYGRVVQIINKIKNRDA